MAELTLIPMVRDEPDHLGGPTTAEVHPDEVKHWQSAGWRISEPEKSKKNAK